MYENGGSLYYTQSLKNEPFSRYGQLKFAMYWGSSMYEPAGLKNFLEQSESELAGYL